jgi:hypothetical protein
MGVIDLYFVDNEVAVLLSMKSSRLHMLYFPLVYCHQAYHSTPEISSPRGYGQIFLADHSLQFLHLFLSNSFYKIVLLFLSGARPALPMGVAPEAIVEKNSGIGSKYNIVA